MGWTEYVSPYRWIPLTKEDTMSKKEYKITDDELRRGAAICPDVKKALKEMFPTADVWEEDEWEDITDECVLDTRPEFGNLAIRYKGEQIMNADVAEIYGLNDGPEIKYKDGKILIKRD